MNYYKVAILKSPLEPLTYQSVQDIKIGQEVYVQLARRKSDLLAVVVEKVDQPSFKCSDIISVTNRYYDDMMLVSAKFISAYYICSLSEALSIYTPFDQTLDIEDKIDYNSDKIMLSNIQQKLYNFTKKNRLSLLFSATGSGKTEIYIKSMLDTVSKNKQVVMLMPEIALTPQMQKRLELVFGNSVAIWHSKITKKRKIEILQQLQKGKINIIAGARSALFLPYKNLGLIIVDEEHDDSYKSEQKPRLNAKDLSLYIGQRFDIQVILGSATPSLNSYYKVPCIVNTQTYFDTTKKILFDQQNVGLDDMVVDNIKEVLAKNEQVIVFLPTRANFKYQICSDCGKSLECPFCSVSLSLHKDQNSLRCHYCNYIQHLVSNCPSCGGLIKNYRLGTAEIASQLENIFNDKIVAKFDRDSIKTNGQLKKILKKFNDNKIDILVGTQMLSKGHDYHNVTLAVILGIDSVLNMTSYRSREKALSLALQISGRSGRKGQGKVIIQTKNKDFFEKYMLKQSYQDFLDDELEKRANLYPPAVKLAKVVFSHKNYQLAYNELNRYVQKFQNLNDPELIGFKECDIFKIANRYRYELLLRSKNNRSLINLLHTIDTPLASIDMDCLV